MRCPSCLQAIHRGAAVCPHCGFELTRADARFGVAPRRPLFDDGAGLVRREQQYRIDRRRAQFERRFPQLSLGVVSVAAVEADLREYAFWLLNRAEFTDWRAGQSRQGLVLLVIDARAWAATLVWGYWLDPYLSEADSFEILRRAHAYWLEERYSDGIERVMEQLSYSLARRIRLGRGRGGRA